MKCRFWTTSFKLLLFFCLPATAAAQTLLNVAADIESVRGIRGRTPEITRCDVRFTLMRRNSGWLVKTLSGTWNGQRIAAENYEFNPNAPKKEPLDRALSMLVPYVTGNLLRVPANMGSTPLSKAYMHELLRHQGFEPEKMQLEGQWQGDAPRSVLTIKGEGGGQRIDYRMTLGADIEIVFNYGIIVRMPEGAPLAAGLEIETSGKGVITVSSHAGP